MWSTLYRGCVAIHDLWNWKLQLYQTSCALQRDSQTFESVRSTMLTLPAPQFFSRIVEFLQRVSTRSNWFAPCNVSHLNPIIHKAEPSDANQPKQNHTCLNSRAILNQSWDTIHHNILNITTLLLFRCKPTRSRHDEMAPCTKSVIYMRKQTRVEGSLNWFHVVRSIPVSIGGGKWAGRNSMLNTVVSTPLVLSN